MTIMILFILTTNKYVMTQWINSWFRQLTTVCVLSHYEQINVDSEWCGKASQVFFFSFFSVLQVIL